MPRLAGPHMVSGVPGYSWVVMLMVMRVAGVCVCLNVRVCQQAAIAGTGVYVCVSVCCVYLVCVGLCVYGGLWQV